MILYCYGDGCPLRAECYRHTQPVRGRDAFGAPPYDPLTGACEHFYSNLPAEEDIRAAAYHIWLRNGRPANRDLEHWYEAYLALCLSSGRIGSALGRTI
jgi:hypothetical protein